MMTIEELEKSDLVLFRSIRGSHLFNLSTPESDIDKFGVFCCPQRWLLGTLDSHKHGGQVYQNCIKDEKGDHYYSELDKYINELKCSNPEALCSLFTPPDLIEFMDPCLRPLVDMREELLTKAAYPAFKGYARSQLGKAHGYNKAMNIDPEEVKERRSILYFCNILRPKNTGDITLEQWLKENGLKQEHCGISKSRHGVEMYTLYYDWFADKELDPEVYIRLRYGRVLHEFNRRELMAELEEGKKTEMIKYRGLVVSDSTQLRCSDISKEDALEPLIGFQFNLPAFQHHCKQYKAYWDWVANRNPERYANNVGFSWDGKNTSHCLRIMRMAIEIASGKGMILDRGLAGDRDLLLKIKHHGFSYEEVNDMLMKTESEMKEAFDRSTLPDEPDKDKLEELLLQIREDRYGLKGI